MLKERFRNLSVGKKLIVGSSAAIIVVLGLFAVVMTSVMSGSIRRQVTQELKDKVGLTRDMIDVYNSRLQNETGTLLTVFKSYYHGSFSLDERSTVAVNGAMVPVLRSGGSVMNLNHAPVDEFTRQTGGVATVFVRSGSDFVRAATSLKKEDGSRALGTPLAHDHPAYQKLMNGEGYIGKAVLFGKDYMTKYQPIRDAQGRVVGAFFVGLDFTEGLAALKKNIKAIAVAGSGYLYVLDDSKGHQGTVLIHPSLEGKSILEYRDVKGFEFVKAMVQDEKVSGVLRYYWNNNWKSTDEKSGAQEKMIAYERYPGWNWIIAGGSTVDELMKDVYAMRNYLAVASILLVVLLSFLIAYLSRVIVSRPLLATVDMLRELSRGHLDRRVAVESRDEIGLLNENMNGFADDLQHSVVGTLKKIADGDLSSEIAPKDEGDEISPALKKTIESLRALIAETRRLSDDAVAGNLKTRGSLDRFNGGYRDIVKGINDTLEAVIGPLNMAAGCVDRISRGDIPPKITEAYNGDFNLIKNNLNKCIEAVNALIADSRMLAEAAVEGRLNTRAEASRHQGDFKKIIQGVNGTLDALISPLQQTIAHLEHLSDGKIDEQITADYRGDYNSLKVSFNKCFAAVTLLVADANMLATAAVEGRLGARADVSKHSGDFRRVIEGVNSTLEAVVRPIKDAASVLDRMAHNDFTEKMTGDYRGDLTLIKNDINKVLETLNGSLRKVAEVTVQAAAASQQLSSTAQEMSAGAEEQTAQTAQVASSMQEMSATVQEVAKNAGMVAQKSEQTRQNAVAGGEVVNQTVAGINRIADSVRVLQDAIAALASNSEKIGEIVTVIEDVADQTNLLALNAAIEAARAGEQGRGFAVVADEVRKLAERTTGSTKEIASMVKAIQSETARAADSMKTSASDVENGVVMATSAGNSLSEIVENVKGLQAMVRQIATAAEQQAAAAEEISSNVEAISSVSKQNAQGAQQTSGAAQELSSLTEELSRMVGGFTLEGGTAAKVNAVAAAKKPQQKGFGHAVP